MIFSKIARLASCLAIASLVFVSACKNDDTSTTPTPTADIYPLKTGNYHVYNSYRLDSLTAQRDDSSLRVDSLATGQQVTIAGKSCYETLIFNGGTQSTTDYYTKEGQTISSYRSLIPNGIVISPLVAQILPQGKRWMKIADYNATAEWAIFDTTVTNVTIPGIPTPVNAVISVKGKKIGKESVTIGTKTYASANRFEFSLVATVSIGTITLPLDPIKDIFWIVDDIGIVKEQIPPIDINIALLQVRLRGDGSVRELVRSNLLK